MSHTVEGMKRLNGEISSELDKYNSLGVKEKCIAAGLIFGVAAMTFSVDASFVNPKVSSLLLDSAMIAEAGLLVDTLFTRLSKNSKLKDIEYLTHEQLKNIATACEFVFDRTRRTEIFSKPSKQLNEVLKQGQELLGMSREIGREKEVREDIFANF